MKNRISLATRKPKRLFTFGCSYTAWIWTTWAEIVAYEFKCPLYNFGWPGNSNNLIFNSIQQADAHYSFNKNDLVIVCWSNLLRDSKFTDNSWKRTGIFENFEKFGSDFLNKVVDVNGYYLETLGFIKSTNDLLTYKGCEHHQFSMNSLDIDLDKFIKEKTSNMFNNVCLPSMTSILYNDDYTNKFTYNKIVSDTFKDNHPLPLEHFNYLQSVFDCKFSTDVYQKVESIQNNLIPILRKIPPNVDNILPYSSECTAYIDKNFLWSNELYVDDTNKKYFLLQ